MCEHVHVVITGSDETGKGSIFCGDCGMPMRENVEGDFEERREWVLECTHAGMNYWIRESPIGVTIVDRVDWATVWRSALDALKFANCIDFPVTLVEKEITR